MFICIAGKNNIAVNVLEYLISTHNDNHEFGVICNKNETGRNGWQRSLRLFAHKNGVHEYKLEEVYMKKNMIFFSLEFDQIINPSLFLDARLYNIHFSLLPAYKGVYTSTIPILNGEKYVGVTFHKIDKGIDTGDIIKQTKFELKKTYTARDLYFEYIKKGTELMIAHMKEILENDMFGIPQSIDGSTYYSKKYLDYSQVKINLKNTSYGIERQIKAFTFREYQLPEVYDKKIISIEVTNIRSDKKPGTIVMQNDFGMMLSTIDYNIILYFDRLKELFEACQKGDIKLVKEICSIKAHINETDENGWTAIIVATYNNRIDIVKYLILNGSDITIKDKDGANLLMYAKDVYLDYGDKSLFRLFYGLGLDINEHDYFGYSLMDYAVASNHLELLDEIMND